MPHLIANADDFGLTAGVNRAILELHQSALLTSATLMARAAATEEAIEIARSTPSLGVGCHVVLVDGDPILPPAQIPSLIDKSTGRLFPTLGTFLPRLFAGRIDPREMEAEAAAQIRHLQSYGLSLTHVDLHKHTHMFPRVLRPVLRAAHACGIRTVRNPFEPAWSVRAASTGFVRSTQVSVLRALRSTWSRIVTEESFATTDGALAVAATGALDATTLRSILAQIPDGTWELVTHPGYNDAGLACVRTRLRDSRDTERRVLNVLHEFPTLNLINFSAFDANLLKGTDRSAIGRNHEEHNS